MNDYKELINKLRNACEWCNGSTPHCKVYKNMQQAADAIEQLVKERDAARKERDVAVADIKKCWLCASCRNHIESKEWCFCYHFDPEMDSDGCTTCENYEWRGVQECE